MAEKNYGADFIAGFLVGALVGAAAALLLAPQSGEETRDLIRERGIELGHRADELSMEARKKAEDFQIQVKQATSEMHLFPGPHFQSVNLQCDFQRLPAQGNPLNRNRSSESL